MCKDSTKSTPVFLPADGEASWSLLPSLVSLLSGGTVQPENTFSSILKVFFLGDPNVVTSCNLGRL